MRKIGAYVICLVVVLLAYFLWLVADDLVRCRNGVDWLFFLFIATPIVYPGVGIILFVSTILLYSLMPGRSGKRQLIVSAILVAIGILGGLASGFHYENWATYRPRCSIGF